MRATKKTKLLGHWCEGLEEYQDAETLPCVPSFTEDGETEGCDDCNYVILKYCPFCGILLKDKNE